MRKRGAENQPDRIGEVGRVLYIWMGKGNAIGIYQSRAKKEGQWVLERGFPTCPREGLKKDVREDACGPGCREEPVDDRRRWVEGCFRVWGRSGGDQLWEDSEKRLRGRSQRNGAPKDMAMRDGCGRTPPTSYVAGRRFLMSWGIRLRNCFSEPRQGRKNINSPPEEMPPL